MKKHFTFLTLLFVLCSILSYGQEEQSKTYQFINPEVVNNTNTYIEAFSTADMTKFRYADKSNIIEFESGLKVELFSASNLISKGFSVDANRILLSEPKNLGHYVFGLSGDGKTIMQMFTQTKFK